MTMPRRLRTAMLAVHLTASVGWIGGVVAYIALGLAAVTAVDDQTIRGAWIGMEIIGWYAIVPLAAASLVTGLVMALGTRWGLFQHYWVVISLILTVVALAVLLLHMPDVTAAVDVARTATGQDLAALGGDLAHPSIGLVALLVVLVLNIAKPRGLTRHGLRRQRSSSERARPAA